MRETGGLPALVLAWCCHTWARADLPVPRHLLLPRRQAWGWEVGRRLPLGPALQLTLVSGRSGGSTDSEDEEDEEDDGDDGDQDEGEDGEDGPADGQDGQAARGGAGPSPFPSPGPQPPGE